MNRILEEFEKPNPKPGDTWKELFGVYDRNFEKLHNFLITLGTNYNVETFRNCTSKVIKLEHDYVPGNNQLMVFVDGAVQWKNDDYREAGSRSIVFIKDLDVKSEVRVVIIESYSTYLEVKDMVEKIQKEKLEVAKMMDQVTRIYNNTRDYYDRVMTELKQEELVYRKCSLGRVYLGEAYNGKVETT